MKILFVISENKYSGAAKIITWLVNRIAEDNKNQIALYTYLGESDFYSISECVKRVKCNQQDNSRIVRSLRVIHNLHKFIKREQFDLCVSFLPMESMFLMLASIGCKIKTIVAERSDPYYEKTFAANLARKTYRFASGAVFQSEGAKKFFPVNLQRRSIVIENPVFLNHTSIIPYEERNDTIVHIARLYIRQKRQDILLRAFSEILKEHPQMILRIVGDGPDEDKLKKMAENLKIKESVIFVGKSNDIQEELSLAKVFLFSSDYEGMPNSILEAIASGVPVITTDYSPGGATKLLEDNECGFVVSKEDYTMLAERTNNILDNPQLAKKMIEKEMTVCKKYSEEQIYEKWINYFSTVIKNEY